MAWIVCFLLTLGPWSTSTKQLCPSAEIVSTFSSEDVKSGLQGLSCLESLSTQRQIFWRLATVYRQSHEVLSTSECVHP